MPQTLADIIFTPQSVTLADIIALRPYPDDAARSFTKSQHRVYPVIFQPARAYLFRENDVINAVLMAARGFEAVDFTVGPPDSAAAEQMAAIVHEALHRLPPELPVADAGLSIIIRVYTEEEAPLQNPPLNHVDKLLTDHRYRPRNVHDLIVENHAR